MINANIPHPVLSSLTTLFSYFSQDLENIKQTNYFPRFSIFTINHGQHEIDSRLDPAPSVLTEIQPFSRSFEDTLRSLTTVLNANNYINPNNLYNPEKEVNQIKSLLTSLKEVLVTLDNPDSPGEDGMFRDQIRKHIIMITNIDNPSNPSNPNKETLEAAIDQIYTVLNQTEQVKDYQGY